MTTAEQLVGGILIRFNSLTAKVKRLLDPKPSRILVRTPSSQDDHNGDGDGPPSPPLPPAKRDRPKRKTSNQAAAPASASADPSIIVSP